MKSLCKLENIKLILIQCEIKLSHLFVFHGYNKKCQINAKNFNCLFITSSALVLFSSLFFATRLWKKLPWPDIEAVKKFFISISQLFVFYGNNINKCSKNALGVRMFRMLIAYQPQVLSFLFFSFESFLLVTAPERLSFYRSLFCYQGV